MEKIKAFVGHSFAEDDEYVVSKFLDFFNHLKDLQIPFEWDHAEKAEPEELSKKVIHLMTDKNAFIGICTKKERVLPKKELKPLVWNRKYLKIQSTDFAYKTSDWIIQEIGYAFGRGMKIILLLEKGLRKPGGLQGNLEYIEFDRSYPEKSFTKITEMLQKLLPSDVKELGKLVEQSAKPESAEKIDITKTKDEVEDIIIGTDWDENKYNDALINSIILKNEDKENEIIENYIKKFPANENVFKAKSYYFNSLLNKKNTFYKMKELIEKDPRNHEVLSYMANLYEDNDEQDKAQEYFKEAFEIAEDGKRKVHYLSRFIISLVKSGEKDYLEYFDELVKLDEEKKYRDIYFDTLASVSKIRNEGCMYDIAIESILNNDPLNHTKRFDLAYNYSQREKNDLSYLHYKFLTSESNSSAYWNNLGVQASQYYLYSKSIKAYFKAAEMGDTLAMSNIAFEYLARGFIKDAEKMCEKAMQVKDYDKNVASALSSINDKMKFEESEEKKILESARMKKNVLINFGKSIIKPTITNISEDWQHPKCMLSVSITKRKFTATGFYKGKKNVLSGLIRVGDYKTSKSSNQDDDEIKYIVLIEGIVFGHFIRVNYYDCMFNSKQDEMDKVKKELLFIVNDELDKMEGYSSNDYSNFVELNKI